MKYNVEVSKNAEEDAREIYSYIAADSQRNAERWIIALERVFGSLGAFPTRCAIAPEGETIGVEIRQRVFGAYRVLFMVREKTVYILHIRHGARRSLSSNEFEHLG
ncbi:MAG: type II toxin-antitoxin system RelE/ParE family toxin [Planctomycetes bacterium]|nr:type II toxin-antitoxin system RelE/ParE family toxin [Planctomycetota bacterium]